MQFPVFAALRFNQFCQSNPRNPRLQNPCALCFFHTGLKFRKRKFAVWYQHFDDLTPLDFIKACINIASAGIQSDPDHTLMWSGHGHQGTDAKHLHTPGTGQSQRITGCNANPSVRTGTHPHHQTVRPKGETRLLKQGLNFRGDSLGMQALQTLTEGKSSLWGDQSKAEIRGGSVKG